MTRQQLGPYLMPAAYVVIAVILIFGMLFLAVRAALYGVRDWAVTATGENVS